LRVTATGCHLLHWRLPSARGLRTLLPPLLLLLLLLWWRQRLLPMLLAPPTASRPAAS
jgi:hypothetical protein